MYTSACKVPQPFENKIFFLLFFHKILWKIYVFWINESKTEKTPTYFFEWFSEKKIAVMC